MQHVVYVCAVFLGRHFHLSLSSVPLSDRRTSIPERITLNARKKGSFTETLAIGLSIVGGGAPECKEALDNLKELSKDLTQPRASHTKENILRI